MSVVAMAMAVVLTVGSVGSRSVLALPGGVDADGDDFIDGIETQLGSDTADATSTPESVAVAESCFDGEDNDRDGVVDVGDPGCTVAEPVEGTFPAGGVDVFNSALSLDGYALDVLGMGTCIVDFEGQGPVVVQRQEPTGDPRTIPVEIIAMQLSGTGTILPGGTNCPVQSAEGLPLTGTIVESPGQASSGQVIDGNLDPAVDFPADSFFDVFFDIFVDLNGTDFQLVGGPPNGPAGDPVRLANVINSLPPYHGGKNPLCYQVENLAHEHCPKAPPDHYLCYAAKFSPKFEKRTVTLLDQFDAAGSAGNQTRVLKPLLFCNPASKNGEPLYEETGHLKCYAIKPKKSKHTVVVRNQFGQPLAKTKRSTMLCLPTEKNDEGPPQELDHFKCYQAKFPKLQKRDVTLVDQFGTVETQVLAPQMLCNPTSKDGGPIRNPTEHLQCFKIKPKKVDQTVTARNQFGEETVRTTKAVTVCVPSGKSEGTTTTTVTTTTLGDGTTTTLPGTEITLELGYRHLGPGSSQVCGKVTAPSAPGASGQVNMSGPSPGMTTVALNGAGVDTFQLPINSYGQYSVQVQVGTLMTSGNIEVDAQQSTCP
jgi:hypothetical protein